MCVCIYVYILTQTLTYGVELEGIVYMVSLFYGQFHLYINIGFVQQLWEQENKFIGEWHLHIPESISPGKVAYRYQSPVPNPTKVRALCTGYNILLVPYTCTYCVWIPDLCAYRLQNLNPQETSIFFPVANEITI